MVLIAATRWKEELYVVDEQGRWFMFGCGWGSDPLTASVPRADQWAACVPAWLHDRRDEVIAAIEAVNHRVVDARERELQTPDPREGVDFWSTVGRESR